MIARRTPTQFLLMFLLLLGSRAEAEIVVGAGFSCAQPGLFYGASLVSVDRASGDRSVVSGADPSGPGGDCLEVGSGPAFTDLKALDVDANGDFLVADGSGNDAARLIQVDAVTGDRTIVSGCLATAEGSNCYGGYLGTGPSLGFIGNVAIISPEQATASPVLSGRQGDALISAYLGPDDCFGESILLVDLSTGDRTVVSGADAGCPATTVGDGDDFTEAESLELAEDGTLWIGDGDVGPARLMRVDLATGDRTVISGCSISLFFGCDGPVVGTGVDLGYIPGIAQPDPPLGPIYLSAGLTQCYSGSIVSVDPSTGDRTVISGEVADCSQVGVGTLFNDIGRLSVAADGSLLTVDGDFGPRILRVDPSTGARNVVSGCTDILSSPLSCDPPETYLGSGPQWTNVDGPIEFSSGGGTGGVDSDLDGVTDAVDNCLFIPNGPLQGTCTDGDPFSIGLSCQDNPTCGFPGVCSQAQEDSDVPPNGIGDACDLASSGIATSNQSIQSSDQPSYRWRDCTECTYVNPDDGSLPDALPVGSVGLECIFTAISNTEVSTIASYIGPAPSPPSGQLCCAWEAQCGIGCSVDASTGTASDGAVYICPISEADKCPRNDEDIVPSSNPLALVDVNSRPSPLTGVPYPACCFTASGVGAHQWGPEFSPGLPPDLDGDTVADICDNCSSLGNPGQEDADGDVRGDACDTENNSRYVCGDTDSDGCDDCSMGHFDPNNDGIDPANPDTSPICVPEPSTMQGLVLGLIWLLGLARKRAGHLHGASA